MSGALIRSLRLSPVLRTCTQKASESGVPRYPITYAEKMAYFTGITFVINIPVIILILKIKDWRRNVITSEDNVI